MRVVCTSFVVLLILAVAQPTFASRIWTAHLTGDQETPPNESHRTGNGVFMPFASDDSLRFDVKWQGVQGSFTGIHIHHGAPGAPGPIVISLVPFRQGNQAHGVVALPDSVRDWLFAGELYVNVHSAFFPAGEIRGQLVCQTDTVAFEPDEIGESYCLALCGGATDTSRIAFGPAAVGQIPTVSIQLGCMINGQPCDTSNDENHIVDNGCTPATTYTTAAEWVWVDSTYYLAVQGDGCICVTLESFAPNPGSPRPGSTDKEAALKDGAVADENALYLNYPNPFNPVTEISFNVKEAGWVRLRVYDIMGRLVTQLAAGEMSAGLHSVSFDGANLPSGVYLYRLEMNGFTDQKKMLLLK